MRVPIRWLHDHCRPALDPAQLAERLDMTGTKVERVLRQFALNDALCFA